MFNFAQMKLIVTYDDIEEAGTDADGQVVVHYQGQPLTGIIVEHSEIGQLLSESEYTDGLLGGIQRQYYPNGQMQEEYTIINNKMEGTFTEWDEQGNVTGVTHWKNGAIVDENDNDYKGF